MDTGDTRPPDFIFYISGEPGSGGWPTLIKGLEVLLFPGSPSARDHGIESFEVSGDEDSATIKVWYRRGFLPEPVQAYVLEVLRDLANNPLYFNPANPGLVSGFSRFDPM